MDYGALVADAKSRALAYMDDKDGWKQSNKSTDVFTIETKSSDKYKCNVLRIKITVDAPVKLCMDTLSLMPGTRRGEWDGDLRETKHLEDVADKAVLFYVHTNSVGKGVISPREFVDVAKTEESGDATLAYGCSVDHPAMTTDDKYVRAFNGCWLHKFTKDPSKEGSTVVQSIIESEMKGWIPSALLNTTVPAVFAQSLTNWMAFLAKDQGAQS